MASVEDDDNYAEDECTMEFGEEDLSEVPSSTRYPTTGVVGGPRFIEYPGEDFSKYLSDAPIDNNKYSQVSCTWGNDLIMINRKI